MLIAAYITVSNNCFITHVFGQKKEKQIFLLFTDAGKCSVVQHRWHMNAIWVWVTG